MSTDIDTSNDHLVGTQGGRIVILMPPLAPMDKDEALRLAAWIVALADFEGDRFPAVLEAVQNT